jgi:hypothetical protein
VSDPPLPQINRLEEPRKGMLYQIDRMRKRGIGGLVSTMDDDIDIRWTRAW